jgi:hypothetical protein
MGILLWDGFSKKKEKWRLTNNRRANTSNPTKALQWDHFPGDPKLRRRRESWQAMADHLNHYLNPRSSARSKELRAEGYSVREEDVARLLALVFEHINLLGGATKLCNAFSSERRHRLFLAWDLARMVPLARPWDRLRAGSAAIAASILFPSPNTGLSLENWSEIQTWATYKSNSGNGDNERASQHALKVKFQDLELSTDFGIEQGLADTGDLEFDLSELLAQVGRAAAERGTALVLALDELQYLPNAELAALISALHKTSQRQLPVTMVGAGLPQLIGQTGRAKSYAERLFEFTPIDRLDKEAAKAALCKPAQREGVAFSGAAIAEILQQTEGYPYFLQEWGKHSWNAAKRSPIDQGDAARATFQAVAELDASFFRVRFDRLTPAEKRYLRAMADLGPGSQRSGDIADKVGKKVTAIGPVRNALITKGMIYSPSHGDNAFTVPLFDGFMKRIMPVL